MLIDDFTTYLIRDGHTDSTIKSYLRVVNMFLNWCNIKGHDVENLTYNQCTTYFRELQNKRTKHDLKLKDTTIKSYVGAIKKYFIYLVSEDVYTVSPLENYDYTVDKDYTHDVLSFEELKQLYICYPTLDIKFPNCKSVAIRNKVLTGLMVFQGIDTKILKHLTVNHVDLNKRKLIVPGTKKSEPKTFILSNEQIDYLRQYLLFDRPILQNKINNHSQALFPLNSNRYSIITCQVIKVLKSINFKVRNNHQIRASVMSLWVQNDDLRTAQKKSRHRFITSTENYKKYNPNTNREAADKYHVMR